MANIIKTPDNYDPSQIIRSKRSELIGFHCDECNTTYIDVKYDRIGYIYEDYWFCKDCVDKILKEEEANNV